MINQDQILHEKKPWYRRTWFIIVAILFLLWAVFTWYAFKLDDAAINSGNFTRLPGAGNVQPTLYDVATNDDPQIGFTAAPVTIVEFGDFECPFCKQVAPTLKQLLANYPDTLKIIYRDFPVSSIHPNALPSAVAANCAANQGKFWEFHDALYAAQDNLSTNFYNNLAQSLGLNMSLFSICLNSTAVVQEIQQDFEAGIDAGVIGTPTFYVNGHKIEGALPYEVWVNVITDAVKVKFTK